jgi:AbrB family looped-hinge helix DNA binding protein
MDQHRPGSKIAEELLCRATGATMAEIIRATGGPQYNVLTKLQGRGYTMRKIKEGRTTRYFAASPAAPSIQTTVTRQGQMTIPKDIRERLGVRAGGKLRLLIEADDRVVIVPAELSVKRLFGILGKPRRRATLEQMDEVIRAGAVEKYLRTKR